MGTMRLIWGYLEKFSLAMWGLNIMDILTISDIDFFKDIDENLKTYFVKLLIVYNFYFQLYL